VNGDPAEVELATLYRTHRVGDQKRWFASRAMEYRRARNQSRMITAGLLVLAAVSASCASVDVAGGRVWWAVGSAGLSALAAALTGYEEVFGFDRLSRDYERAIGVLAHLELSIEFDRPDPGVASPADSVGRVEDELLAEVRGWATATAATAAAAAAPTEPDGDPPEPGPVS
jgi:SMODS and SLOG-associating 2TM effector domain 1